MYQYYKEVKGTRVNTKIAGGMRLLVHDIDRAGKPDRNRQKLGVVPNLIHSLDSSHMVLTINNVGVEDMLMVHDDYCCHAAFMDKMYISAREAFHHMYTSIDPLESWAKSQGIALQDLPAKGKYDITEILQAPYFFGM